MQMALKVKTKGGDPSGGGGQPEPYRDGRVPRPHARMEPYKQARHRSVAAGDLLGSGRAVRAAPMAAPRKSRAAADGQRQTPPSVAEELLDITSYPGVGFRFLLGPSLTFSPAWGDDAQPRKRNRKVLPLDEAKAGSHVIVRNLGQGTQLLVIDTQGKHASMMDEPAERGGNDWQDTEGERRERYWE